MSHVARRLDIRRTQGERSQTTRTRLLEATVSALEDVGYDGTTVTEVCDRAGVSRGAQLHHYPTKEELVLAAVEWLFHKRQEEFRAAFAQLPAAADKRKVAIDLLWKFIGKEKTFYAWLELAVAGRTDPKLGKRVRELGSRTAAAVEATFRELFPSPSGPPNPFFEHAPRFAFAVLQGLAVNGLMVGEPKYQADNVIKMLKQLAELFLEGGRS
jgi:AcrR family transcriptional regulator